MRPTIFLLVLPRRKTVPRPVPERRGRWTRESLSLVSTPYARLSDLVLDWSVVYTRSRSLPRKARCARAAGHAVIWRSHRRGRRPRRPGGKTRTSCLLRRIHTMLHTYRRGDSRIARRYSLLTPHRPGEFASSKLGPPRASAPTTKPYSVTASPQGRGLPLPRGTGLRYQTIPANPPGR